MPQYLLFFSFLDMKSVFHFWLLASESRQQAYPPPTPAILLCSCPWIQGLPALSSPRIWITSVYHSQFFILIFNVNEFEVLYLNRIRQYLRF